jgi:glycosyltransferase involved in cell wall biosynthesis
MEEFLYLIFSRQELSPFQGAKARIMPSRPHLLFIQPSQASFVVADIAALSQRYCVNVRMFYFKPVWRQAWSQITLLFWLLRHLPAADGLYAWFADYHTVLPVLLGRLLGRPVYIVLGGYDVARLPGFGYGAHLHWFRSGCSRVSLRWATQLLPVSCATADELAALGRHAPARVIYNGVDTSFFRPVAGAERDIGVLTICGARDKRSAEIKGMEEYLQVARRQPAVGFWVVGLEEEALTWARSLRPAENVHLQPRVSRKELAALYARTRVYCQFSHHESFGMALAEAMACGCLPVVTNTGALPEVVGDAGWIIAGRDAAHLAAAVGTALQAEPGRRERARARIVECFAMEKRQAALAALFAEEFAS